MSRQTLMCVCVLRSLFIFYFFNLKIQIGLPRCVLSVPISEVAVILSTWALFTVATAVTFRTRRKAALMDSGLLSTLRAINYYPPKCRGLGAGDRITATPRGRLCPSSAGTKTWEGLSGTPPSALTA